MPKLVDTSKPPVDANRELEHHRSVMSMRHSVEIRLHSPISDNAKGFLCAFEESQNKRKQEKTMDYVDQHRLRFVLYDQNLPSQKPDIPG